jgi:hypothetical protein
VGALGLIFEPVPIGEGVVSRRIDGKDFEESGDAEQPQDLTLGDGEAYLAAFFFGPALPADQRTETGRIEKLDLVQVDDDTVVASVCGFEQGSANRRRGRDVEASRELEDVRLACFMDVNREIFMGFHGGLPPELAPLGNRFSVEGNDRTPIVLPPLPVRTSQGKTIDHDPPISSFRFDELPDVPAPLWTVVEKAREMLGNRRSPDDRFTIGLAEGTLLREATRRADFISRAAGRDELFDRSALRHETRMWLGRLDSNQRMPESKSGALPTWLRPIPGPIPYRIALS